MRVSPLLQNGCRMKQREGRGLPQHSLPNYQRLREYTYDVRRGPTWGVSGFDQRRHVGKYRYQIGGVGGGVGERVYMMEWISSFRFVQNCR